jgi:DNA-directed RNA polymerase specialized sigma24 family protein
VVEAYDSLVEGKRRVTHGTRREQGYAAFVAEYRMPLLRTALLLTGVQEHAEKLVGATLLKVYLRWDRFAEGGSPHLFAHETLVRRYARRWGTAATLEPAGAGAGAAAGLSRREWAALVLHRHEGLSADRIAELLGCGVESVRSACRSSKHLVTEAEPARRRPQPQHRPEDLGALLARGRRAQRWWDGARALGVLVLVVGCGVAAAGMAGAAAHCG